MNNKFNFVIPAQIEKSEDGEWKIAGLASTEDMDQQGEKIIQKGIDLSPIDQKKGYFNFDHLKGPENLIGAIDGYKQSNNGLYVHGRLFKNHQRAKSVYEIMSSLNKNDTGRVGMSVEGQILERDPKNPQVIKKCRIDKVAVTLNPVNQKTYADLIKSMSGDAEVEFNMTEENYNEEGENKSTYTAEQVLQIVEKALGVGAGYANAPNTLTDGDAMSTSDMKPKKKKKKDDTSDKIEESGMSKEKPIKVKKSISSIYKSKMKSMLVELQDLYPDYSQTQIWEAVKSRLETKFPDINEEYKKQ